MEDTEKSKIGLALELFLMSFTSLFFELIVIRWLSCEFVCFMVFKTFPLVTCFVGLGVGVSKANDALFRMVGPALLLFVLATFTCSIAGLGAVPFPAIGLYQWSDTASGALIWFQVFRMILLIVLLLAGPFAVMVCIGAKIGALFNKQKPLAAYCIDIGGAIAGSLAFALASFLGLPPAAEVGIVSLLLLLYSRRLEKPALIAQTITLLAAACFAFLPSFSDGKTIWSPYARVDVSEVRVPTEYLRRSEGQAAQTNPSSPASHSTLMGIFVSANHGFQQVFAPENKLDLNEEGRKQPALVTLSHFLDVRRHYYGIPYQMKSPLSVLVLGAGTGSDVHEALRNGAAEVDAVEIDPAIVQIGKQYNDDYNSDKLTLFVDDARNFINRSPQKKYDMIIMACLDSLAFSGTGSSMRTDSYIHSKQSYENCLKKLNPEGIFVVSFGAPVSGHNEWLRDKIFKTLESAAGYPPLVETDIDAPYRWPAYVFISGEPVRNKLVSALTIKDSFHPVRMPANVETRILTDDWPYLYIKPLGLDLSYLSVVGVVIAITVYAARQLILAKNSASDAQLFFMGAAFMLLELQAISRLSLLYGTTWVTTSVVINGVLLMILAANFAVLRFGSRFNQNFLYLLLAASLLLSYFLPVSEILKWDEAGAYYGHLSITFLSLLPVFAAGLLFATAFRQVKNGARSFAFNLLGSVAGALLEYLSTYWGVRSLLIVAFAAYLCSFIFSLSESKKQI